MSKSKHIASKTTGTRKPTIIALYDHSCPMCRTEMLKLKGREEAGKGPFALKLVDISAPGFDAHAWGFAPEALNENLHVRDSAGYWHVGMDAVRMVYEAVGLKWLTAPTGWPVMRGIFDQLYGGFARNRMGVSAYLIKRLPFLAMARKSCNDEVCAHNPDA